MNGFIKIPRDFLEWEWWGRMPHHLLFEWLLIMAQPSDRRINGVVVRRGSVLTTWSEMQRAVGCSTGSLSRALRDFSECGEIIVRTERRNTLITICHYENYNGNNGTIWSDSGVIAECKRSDTPIIKREYENKEEYIYSACASDGNDDGFVTEPDCRAWMRRYCDIARKFGVAKDDLPRQLNAKRALKIRVCVRERGRGAVDAMFARLAESAYFFQDGSRGFRGDFTRLWSPSVFDMVLEGSFVPRAKKEKAQREKTGQIGLFETVEPPVPSKQSREEYESDMRRHAREHPESAAAKIVAQWDKGEEEKETEK